MEIKRLNSSDITLGQELRKTLYEIFEEDGKPIENELVSQLLSSDDTLVLAVIDADKIVAGVIAHVVPNLYTGIINLFIEDLGVLAAYRRQGIGKSLIDYCMNYCLENNLGGLYLSAEDDDEQANSFYRSFQTEEIKAIYHNFKIK